MVERVDENTYDLLGLDNIKPLGKSRSFHFSSIIEKPSPPVFLAACIAFAFAVAAFRYSHRQDPFEDHFIVTSIMVAIYLSWASENFLMTVKSMVPWSVILGLILSSLAHRVLGSFSKARFDASGGIAEEMQTVWWREKGEGSNRSLAEISFKNEQPPPI